jgi:hypothetical protein
MQSTVNEEFEHVVVIDKEEKVNKKSSMKRKRKEAEPKPTIEHAVIIDKEETTTLKSSMKRKKEEHAPVIIEDVGKNVEMDPNETTELIEFIELIEYDDITEDEETNKKEGCDAYVETFFKYIKPIDVVDLAEASTLPETIQQVHIVSEDEIDIINRQDTSIILPETIQQVHVVPEDEIEIVDRQDTSVILSPTIQRVHSEEKYQVEYIICSKVKDNLEYYLVKWFGYSITESTWETKEAFDDFEETIKHFSWDVEIQCNVGEIPVFDEIKRFDVKIANFITWNTGYSTFEPK